MTVFLSGEIAPATNRRRATGLRIATGLLLAMSLGLGGCGYTVLKDSPSAEEAQRVVPGQLPPGHPPIETAESWIGRSFLDAWLGEEEFYRFENLRVHPETRAPARHAIVTLRIQAGGPAARQIWQIEMDQFGWATVAAWTQGAAGPELDASLAPARVEFRLARESEGALRVMAADLLPATPRHETPRRRERLAGLPLEIWPYEEPGLLELTYRLEPLGVGDPGEWPGGRIVAPLDLIQLLIVTWDDVPPRDLRELAARVFDDGSQIVAIALLAEAFTLIAEVESEGLEGIALPLRVGR